MSSGNQVQQFSLQAGIEPSRFTSEVRQAVASLRQGTLVAVPPLLFAASPENPLYAATVAWAETERARYGAVNVINRDFRPEWGVIVTQTCDLVEEGAQPKRPWVHVAPVYRLRCDRGQRRMIERERGFDYLCPVAELDSDPEGLWVADLRLLVPVEKGWLVGAATAEGFETRAEHERLARQLSRLFSRPAYPTVLNAKLLRPLGDFLAELTERFDGADPIEEVGLALGRSRVDPSTAQVVFLLDGPLGADLRDAVMEWGEDRIADPPEGINLLMPRIVALDDLSAREYRTMDLIDISAFSPSDLVETSPGSEAPSSEPDSA